MSDFEKKRNKENKVEKPQTPRPKKLGVEESHYISKVVGGSPMDFADQGGLFGGVHLAGRTRCLRQKEEDRREEGRGGSRGEKADL